MLDSWDYYTKCLIVLHPPFFIPAQAGISLVATMVVNWEIPLCRGMKKERNEKKGGGKKIRQQKTQRLAEF